MHDTLFSFEATKFDAINVGTAPAVRFGFFLGPPRFYHLLVEYGSP